MMQKSTVLILCFILFNCIFSLGQQQTSPPRTSPSPTSQTPSSPKPSTLKSQRIFYGEPGRAALYSLILPGAGQLYNKRWWKVPLVFALEGVAIFNLIESLDTYSMWNNCYIDLVEGTDNSPFCVSVDDTSTAFRIRNSARTNKELAFIFMGLAHLLQAVEAFIDRHLINFDTSEDLTFMQPSSNFGSQITLVRIGIPLNSYSSRKPSR